MESNIGHRPFSGVDDARSAAGIRLSSLAIWLYRKVFIERIEKHWPSADSGIARTTQAASRAPSTEAKPLQLFHCLAEIIVFLLQLILALLKRLHPLAEIAGDKDLRELLKHTFLVVVPIES